MPRERLTEIAAILAGIVLLALAILYLAEPARSLPGFLPGHEAGSGHHHVKHGLAALILALGAFALAWFQGGPSAGRRAGIEA